MTHYQEKPHWREPDQAPFSRDPVYWVLLTFTLIAFVGLALLGD